MIVSRGRRYIFVHIPKTGGTALTLALEARAMKDDILIGDTPKARSRRARQQGLTPRGRLWKHSTLADIDGIVSEEELAGMFVLTLVRNPWDRAVSYYHWLRAQSFDHPAVRLAQERDFAGFLGEGWVQRSLEVADYASYVRSAAGVEHCALFARIEALEADLAPFESHLGFSLGPVARNNASVRSRDYRDYFNNETRAIVARLAARDIDRFNYSF